MTFLSSLIFTLSAVDQAAGWLIYTHKYIKNTHTKNTLGSSRSFELLWKDGNKAIFFLWTFLSSWPTCFFIVTQTHFSPSNSTLNDKHCICKTETVGHRLDFSKPCRQFCSATVQAHAANSTDYTRQSGVKSNRHKHHVYSALWKISNLRFSPVTLLLNTHHVFNYWNILVKLNSCYIRNNTGQKVCLL